MLHTYSEKQQETRRDRRYHVCLAQTDSEIRAAQKLRYEVFTEEYGSSLSGPEEGVDADIYDRHCDHLIVRDEIAGRIVGTYRILPPAAAARINSYYSENEFYLTRLNSIRHQLVEVGRSCIAPDHRNGAVITLLWFKLAQYMMQNNYQYLIGCASIPMHDGGHNAANLYLQLSETYMAPEEYRVMPITRLPYDRLINGQTADVPALIKGYLRAGAWICGEPAWDAQFNSTDLMLMLPMARLSPHYRKHFLR
jgi:putative hemolysin